MRQFKAIHDLFHFKAIYSGIRRVPVLGRTQNPNSKKHKNKELIYIPSNLAKEFIKDFHQGLI